MTPDQLLTYKQAAQLLGIPVGTLYSWVSKKQLNFVRLGPRLVRFSRQDIEALIRKNRFVPEAREGVAHD